MLKPTFKVQRDVRNNVDRKKIYLIIINRDSFNKTSQDLIMMVYNFVII